MAPTLETPGVYVNEIPAGVPPSQDVPTSIAAFIGRAAMGPVNEAVQLNSFGDYQRIFGGLSADSAVSYAVSAFFSNGGGQAVVARLFAPPDDGTCTATVALSPGDLVLQAASPGTWGNGLSAAADVDGITAETAKALGVADPADLFNLTVTVTLPGGAVTTERFVNVTLNPAYPALLLRNVLAAESRFVLLGSGDAVPPAGATGTASGGRDSATLPMIAYLGDQSQHTGLYALDHVPVFNILSIPPDQDGVDTPPLVYQTAAAYCVTRRAMLIIDPPVGWQTAFDDRDVAAISRSDLGGFGADEARNSAVYFPQVMAADPLNDGQIRAFPPSGYVAGIWAQTDNETGVWKAPAGIAAPLNGVSGFSALLNDDQTGLLNPQGINCLRSFPVYGPVVWGARTMAGADQLADDYKYIPVRRLALYIENWLAQNTQWAVFEPNDETLWAALRLQIGNFMNSLFRQGGLAGSSANDAYFVTCDASTTTVSDIEQGIVNVVVGFAPMKPAEFVVLSFQQRAAASS